MIIAFVGKARSGKDTAANYLREKGIIEEKEQLARWLKDTAAELFNLPLALLEGLQGDREAPLAEPKIFTAEHFMKIRAAVHPTYEILKGVPLVGKTLRTPREILQFIGADVVRQLDPDFHVKGLAKRVDPRKVTAVTDVRFSNEIDGLKKRGAYLTYVSRPAVKLVGSAGGHISERADSLAHLCDYRLVNDGTLEEFLEKLDKVGDIIKEKRGG